MHIYLIMIHVVAMILSMILMTGAIGMGLVGRKSAARMATLGYVTTLVGSAFGAALLLDSVLSVQCAMLTAYLVVATALYRYGFALGNAEKARLVRRL